MRTTREFINQNKKAFLRLTENTSLIYNTTNTNEILHPMRNANKKLLVLPEKYRNTKTRRIGNKPTRLIPVRNFQASSSLSSRLKTNSHNHLKKKFTFIIPKFERNYKKLII